MTSPRRNLIISPVGSGSVHASWLSHAKDRSFDLFLIHYGEDAGFGRDDADHYAERRGFKWELIAWALEQHGEVIDRYANVWCPDADVRSDTRAIDRLFALFERHRLQLAQPAIASGEVSYQTLRQRPGLVLRYTPCVEVMCPLFTRRALERVAPTFRASRSGWGIDWVWPQHFARDEVAIIDAVGVEHTGTLGGGEHYRKLAALGVEPQREFEQVIARYGGFDRRVHRKFVRGDLRLRAVRAAGGRPGPWTRLRERLGLHLHSA